MANAFKENLRQYFVKELSEQEKSFTLSEEEFAFFRGKTGIEDLQELHDHIKAIRDEAFEIYPYPCIFRYGFAKLKISRMPAYKELLRLGKERPGALFLDLGTCFGNDIRKPVFDGFPAEQAIGSDVQKDFWNLGYKLFKDTPETFPVPFVRGDVFDPQFLPSLPVISEKPTVPLQPLSSLTSLSPLHGRLSVIFCGSFFHLFDEPKQQELAHKVGALLSPESGSFIFGTHLGWPEKKIVADAENAVPGTERFSVFCHSPESWKELWEGVFPEGKVRVGAVLHNVAAEFGGRTIYQLIWTVTRL